MAAKTAVCRCYISESYDYMALYQIKTNVIDIVKVCQDYIDFDLRLKSEERHFRRVSVHLTIIV